MHAQPSLKFPLLLFSQPAGLGLLVETLTRGFEHSADILANVREFAFDAFDVMPLLVLWFFQCVACDTIYLIQKHNLMRDPGVLGGLCNCNMHFITSCLLTVLSRSFEACSLVI